MWVGNTLFAQSAEMGALPTLYAATEPGLAGGRTPAPTGSASSAGIRSSWAAAAWRRTRRPPAGCGRSPRSSRRSGPRSAGPPPRLEGMAVLGRPTPGLRSGAGGGALVTGAARGLGMEIAACSRRGG